MKFTELDIKGVWLIEPRCFVDNRGYFMESFKESAFREHVGDVHFVQDNESMSSYGVVRGLHFQRGAASQAKLVRVSRGRVLDVAVDIRPGSETFGRYVAVELSDENHRQLFIPRGFAHGFAVMSDVAQFQYKVDNVYAPQAEMTLKIDDSELGITWPVAEADMILSPKDLAGRTLAEIREIVAKEPF